MAKIKNLQIVLNTILIGLFLPLSAQEIETSTLTKQNFSIDYPITWELTEDGQMGSSFVIFSPLKNEEDKFRENSNLIIQDLTGYNLDLAGYTKLSISQIESMIKDGTVLSSETIKKDGNVYQKVIFTGTQGAFKLKFEQHYQIINNKAYVITFTAEDTEFESYTPMKMIFLNSLTIQ